MVSRNSSETVKCSLKNKNILNHTKLKMVEYHPELDGTEITNNQALTFIFRRVYQDEYFKFDDNGNWIS